MKLKVFERETNKVYRADDLKLNCHICGKSFAPLSGYHIYTDRAEYYMGTYCREALVVLEDYSAVCNCQNLQRIHVRLFDNGEEINRMGFYMWMYDKKDDMEGKKHVE